MKKQKRSRGIKISLFSLSLLTPLCPALADQDFSALSLDDLVNIKVQTVSRRDENLDQAPNTIYVITKEQIRERGYQRLQDVLQVIPGFGVAHRDLAWVNQIRRHCAQ